MSSNFCTPTAAQARPARLAWAPRWALLIAAFVALSGGRAAAAATARFGDVVTVPGNALARFSGYRIDQLALFACAATACRVIPSQIDERDAAGSWVLDQGPEPNADDPPGVLDDNDVLLFMAADAADRAARAALPVGLPALELVLTDPLDGATRWAYLVAFPTTAPRADAAYVQYDPASDRVRGRRVTLGFQHGVPGYLALATDGTETNLLDRFKVRATAKFLWGLIRFSRSEDDITTQFVAYRQGPIRVIRRQRQWVRLGWGIHSPTFGSYTYFYSDGAELPVSLYLNFPPTYFFGDIEIRAVLDFRDLRGWSVLVPGRPAFAVDGVLTPDKAALNQLPATWFALLGPDITLVQVFNVGASLSNVRRRLLYHESPTKGDAPEDTAGELPGIGYQLDRWEKVPAGAHQLQSISYAVPRDIDVPGFLAARNAPLRVGVQPMP